MKFVGSMVQVDGEKLGEMLLIQFAVAALVTCVGIWKSAGLAWEVVDEKVEVVFCDFSYNSVGGYSRFVLAGVVSK